MTEATQWIVDLMIFDVGKVAVGLLVLILIIELITRVKEWLT